MELTPSIIQETSYRDFTVERDREFLLWMVSAKADGTRVPTVLRGKWTSLELAKQAIDSYLDSKAQKQSVKKIEDEEVVD
jgi:hypothetical protein